MRLIRYQDRQGKTGWASEQADGSALALAGSPLQSLALTGRKADVAKLLAPVEFPPPVIMCIGANYKRHIEECNAPVPPHPVLFVKNPGAVQNPDDPIWLPVGLKSEMVDYEAELAFVIGRTCKNVKADQALDYVLGYTCANDVSARDWQRNGGGGQWCRGKGFDSFAPLGPCLVTADEIPNPNNLRIQGRLNGKTVQDSNTSDMLFDIPTLIAFLSGSTTLLPGTVILTGTPSGVGMAKEPPVWLKPGDDYAVEIERIGTLANPVLLEKL
jgi:2-keto-4-pentenoate hydratase/2-oxohepta-3-ene-1,7-dioic acid hydratase in catechol pathway